MPIGTLYEKNEIHEESSKHSTCVGSLRRHFTRKGPWRVDRISQGQIHVAWWLSARSRNPQIIDLEPDRSLADRVYSIKQSVRRISAPRTSRTASRRKVPVARQAGSRDPVRRSVVETERETAIQKIAGHTQDTADGGARKRALAEGNTRKPAVLGIVPVRQGRRPVEGR